MNANWVLVLPGLLVALVAAALLFLGALESGPAAVIGIGGIGLMAAAARARRPRS